KNAWFAEQKGLHIDAWAQINGLEFEGKNYHVQFSDAAPNQAAEKLWLINLGGYDAREFGELHRYVLVVAQNAMVAKQRGKAYFAKHWQNSILTGCWMSMIALRLIRCMADMYSWWRDILVRIAGKIPISRFKTEAEGYSVAECQDSTSDLKKIFIKVQ